MANSIYVFRALTVFGFITQWVFMIFNGAFVEMLVRAWEGSFATGTPVKSWTGVWAVDYVQNLLVVFFGAVNSAAELPDLGPWLMLFDLVFALVVFNLMTVVEDKRNEKNRTAPLTSPSFWQFAWNWLGAASVLPVYCHLYLRERSEKRLGRLSVDQAHALPLTALWCLVVSLPLLLPSAIDATAFNIQNGIVIWQFGPLTLGLFQDLCAHLVGRLGLRLTRDPVAVAYGIVGAASAAIHMGALYWAWRSPMLSWSRIYLPDHGAVEPEGPALLREGAMLFMQYDIIVIWACVLLTTYVMNKGHGRGQGSSGAPATWVVAVTSVVAGPGAALAWILGAEERHAVAFDEVKVA